MRKSVFGIFDQLRLKPACSASETSLETSDTETSHYTIQAANNKGADQTEQMRRLICAFVIHICP